MKKDKIYQIISMSIFIIGILILFCPTALSIIEKNRLESTLATYENDLSKIDNQKQIEMLNNAKKYNEMLFSNGNTYYDKKVNEHIDMGNGIIGRIEIPIIDVDLPIYNGTSDEILSIGAGHLERTSLPVGGENTHSVITAHRGLPNSKLFTRLDELEKGDMFYISILGENLAYKIYERREVLPNDTSLFNISKGKDIVSLVTCTPYGINTHRLILSGERVEFNESIKNNTNEKIMSLRESIFFILPIIFLIIGVVIFINERRKKQNEIKNAKDINISNSSINDINSHNND